MFRIYHGRMGEGSQSVDKILAPLSHPDPQKAKLRTRRYVSVGNSVSSKWERGRGVRAFCRQLCAPDP
jgi:hypothetical protein